MEEASLMPWPLSCLPLNGWVDKWFCYTKIIQNLCPLHWQVMMQWGSFPSSALTWCSLSSTQFTSTGATFSLPSPFHFESHEEMMELYYDWCLTIEITLNINSVNVDPADMLLQEQEDNTWWHCAVCVLMSVFTKEKFRVRWAQARMKSQHWTHELQHKLLRARTKCLNSKTCPGCFVTGLETRYQSSNVILTP